MIQCRLASLKLGAARTNLVRCNRNCSEVACIHDAKHMARFVLETTGSNTFLHVSINFCRKKDL
jgi:hypothetical protein